MNLIGKNKIIRITTVPVSLKILLRGQLKFLQEHYEVVGVSSRGNELQEVEKAENIRVYAVDMSRSITPLRDGASLIRLYSFLRKEKPHIVHTHTPKAGFIGMTAAFFARVPHRLHTVAGLPLMEAKGIKRHVLLFVEKFTYRLSTLVLPNSSGIKDFIIENRLIKPGKLKIIGNGSSNGIDLEYFNYSEEIKVQSDNFIEQHNLSGKFVFLFVGRMVSHKGINELVSAFIKVNKNHPKTVLLLVGEFEHELDPLNDSTLKSLKIPSIICTGHQRDVRMYLNIANAFVFPSYREGFPNVVLQACAFNLPCIVTDINGCNEIIRNNENGILVRPKDERALAEAMDYLLVNPDVRENLRKGNREEIKGKYDQKYVWNKVLELYSSLQ